MRCSRGGGAGVAVLALVVSLLSCAESVTPPEAGTSPQFSVGGSSLLICPGGAGEASEGTIEVVGGKLAHGRRHALVLPAGAVATGTQFRITEPVSEYMEINIKANGREGFSFGETALITIDYSRCAASSLPATALAVWKIDPASKALLKRMPSLDDRLARKVAFQTDSLSSYSIAQ